MSVSSALVDLAAELRDEHSVISPHVADPVVGPALGPLVAAGPRTAAAPAEYAAVIECVREGYLLHYDQPRLVEPPDDDLALLAGDYLYAKGLARLAALGDPRAIGELCDLISLAARLHATASAERSTTEALWLSAAIAIAAGLDAAAHESAKQILRTGCDVRPLWKLARERAEATGLAHQLTTTAEAVGFAPSDLG